MGGHSRQLGDCLRRILFSGAGESNWTLSIQRSTIENYLRGHYPGGVLRVLGFLSEGRVDWNYLAGVALMVGAVFVIFKEW